PAAAVRPVAGTRRGADPQPAPYDGQQIYHPVQRTPGRDGAGLILDFGLGPAWGAAYHGREGEPFAWRPQRRTAFAWSSGVPSLAARAVANTSPLRPLSWRFYTAPFGSACSRDVWR